MSCARCAALVLGAIALFSCPTPTRADAPVLLMAEPDALAACHSLEVELLGLGVHTERLVLTTHDPDEVSAAAHAGRAALVLCRSVPLRFEIYRGPTAADALSRAPDHVALSSPADPEAAAVEASEWIRALLIELPDVPEAQPSAEAVSPAPPRSTSFPAAPPSEVERGPFHPTFGFSLVYVYADRTLRSLAAAGSVAFSLGDHVALAARVTLGAQPPRTVQTTEPYRVRSDRLELGVDHVADLGRVSLRSGLHLAGTRVVVRGLIGPDRAPRTDARVVGTGLLRLALAYRVTARVAVGLETDAGVLFRDVVVAQSEGRASVGRFLGSFGLRLEVTP